MESYVIRDYTYLALTTWLLMPWQKGAYFSYRNYLLNTRWTPNMFTGSELIFSKQIVYLHYVYKSNGQKEG